MVGSHCQCAGTMTFGGGRCMTACGSQQNRVERLSFTKSDKNPNQNDAGIQSGSTNMEPRQDGF